MPPAKRSSVAKMHGGRPRNSPGLRRGQTVWAACPPFALKRHYSAWLTWPWPPAPPTPAIFIAMRNFFQTPLGKRSIQGGSHSVRIAAGSHPGLTSGGRWHIQHLRRRGSGYAPRDNSHKDNGGRGFRRLPKIDTRDVRPVYPGYAKKR